MNIRRTAVGIALSVFAGAAGAQCQWDAAGAPAGLVPRGVIRAPLGGTESLIFAGGDVAAFDGAQWTVLENGSFVARAVAWYDRGEGPELYAAGLSGSHTAIQRWTGSVWQPAGSNHFIPAYPGQGPGHMSYSFRHIGAITSLAVFNDGSGERLYAAGSSGPDGYTSLYRFNDYFQVGTPLWSAVGGPILGGPGTGWLDRPFISSLAVFDDGSGPALYAAGRIVSAGGVPLPNLGRFDGQKWSAVGTIWPSAGGMLTVLDDGSGAAMYWTNMRWDGQSWSGVGRGTNEAPLAAYQGPGEVGPALYSFAHGSTERRGASGWTTVAGALSGSLTGYFNTPQFVVAASFDAGPTGLFVGGDFTHAGGVPMTGVARLTCAGACYPDCNGDGALNLADFGCFQTRMGGADPYADCNGDGALNLADFGCFQTGFALGCP